jgi:Flp pilus assembly protein TadD
MTHLDDPLTIGWTFHQRRDYVGAEAIYRREIEANPANANAWCFLGILYYDLSRFEDSVQAYGRALEVKPEFPVALSNLANSLGALERFEEAEASVRKALELNPKYPTAWNNLGALLVKQGKFREATETFEKSLELMPDNESVHRNLGATLIRQGRLAEGSQYSESALRLNPRSAEAHRNRAIVWLLTGNFAPGWDEYEWRFYCSDHAPSRHPQPMWDGSPFPGKTLLLFAEQGLGDTIHFLRYAEMARERGGRVVVECQSALLPLLSNFRGADELVARGQPLPPFDLQLPLMSAPRVFRTDEKSIPAPIPYLTARQDLRAQWQDRLASRVPAERLRVGLVWQGSRDHHADRQRSIPLAEFLPLADQPIQLISLQKGEGTGQMTPLADQLPLLDFGSTLDEAHGPFLDTAAILANIDLLITIDTSVAHLAGAMGIPTWVLLSHAPDWRWLLDRDDSPWYPSIRLFRQDSGGEWKSVLDRVASELKGFATLKPSLSRSRASSGELKYLHVPLSPGYCLDLLAKLDSQLEILEGATSTDASSEIESPERQRLAEQRDRLVEVLRGKLPWERIAARNQTGHESPRSLPEDAPVPSDELELAFRQLREIHRRLCRLSGRDEGGEGSIGRVTSPYPADEEQSQLLAGVLREQAALIRRIDTIMER